MIAVMQKFSFIFNVKQHLKIPVACIQRGERQRYDTTNAMFDECGSIASKRKKINVVIPKHLQMLKLRIDEQYYQHYDFKQIESKFINYNIIIII